MPCTPGTKQACKRCFESTRPTGQKRFALCVPSVSSGEADDGGGCRSRRSAAQRKYAGVTRLLTDAPSEKLISSVKKPPQRLFECRCRSGFLVCDYSAGNQMRIWFSPRLPHIK